MKDLTFVLCSRNDGYGGNSLWRLQTSINFLAHHAAVLDILDRIEVFVSDWGSVEPLRDAVRLSHEACRIARFVEVPVEVARAHQRDSVFAEVLANNTAIRRATGRFVARIDQDTLVGPRFLAAFLALAARGTVHGGSVEAAPMFVGRRSISYSFARTSPALERVLSLVERCGYLLPRE